MFRYARNLQISKPLIEHSELCFISKLRAECYTLLGKGEAVSSSGSYSRYHNEPINNLKILHMIRSRHEELHWLVMTSRCRHVFILRTIPSRTYACQAVEIMDSAMK